MDSGIGSDNDEPEGDNPKKRMRKMEKNGDRGKTQDLDVEEVAANDKVAAQKTASVSRVVYTRQQFLTSFASIQQTTLQQSQLFQVSLCSSQ